MIKMKSKQKSTLSKLLKFAGKHRFFIILAIFLSGVIIMPIAIIVILVVFDWRLGLVCLAPIFLSLLILRQMMGGDNAAFMKTYMDALEDMNASAVEYVRGIPVVKVFQQDDSCRNFHSLAR